MDESNDQNSCLFCLFRIELVFVQFGAFFYISNLDKKKVRKAKKSDECDEMLKENMEKDSFIFSAFTKKKFFQVNRT